jgi:hypothetical protein
MPEQIKKIKNKLAYSELSKKVYYINGGGNAKTDVTQSFFQMILLWMHDGRPLVDKGTVLTNELITNGVPHWKITLEKLT